MVKSISSPPAPPLQLSPSEPFTVDLAESAPTPDQERGAHPLPRVAPLYRVRIQLSGRHPSECATDMTTKVEEVVAPRDKAQDAQMYRVFHK